MGFFSSVWNWFTGSSITSSLAKTALLGYASRLLSGNTDPGSTGTTPEPDRGVRLQLDPSTDNQIPVLYGEAYFGGNITDAALSADYKKMTYCLTLAEVTGEKLSDGNQTGFIFKGVYLNNNRVVFKADGFTVDYTLDPSGNQDISYRDLIKIYFYVNGPLQPQGSSGTTPAAHTVMPGWTSTTHPMTDLIYAIVDVTYNKDKNVTGLPDCIFRVDTNMKKPGDVLVDYMISTVYGAGIPVTDIDASFIDLNTYAATGFTYTNKIGQSATSAITINGLIDTTQPVLDNMKKLADAANAWISYDTTTGKWVVVINKAGTSVASFTDSNMIGDISISGTSLTQLNSAADVKYQNTDILDKTDFVKIAIPSGDLYANEPGKVIEIALPFTNSQVVAAKIGLVQLKQGRIDKIIKFKSDFSYINLTAGDLIDVTTSTYGFTNKVFRIITIAESFDEEGVLSMDITALEYDSAVYDYNITEFDVETDGGILGIGSIGKPNTPTVTKTEEAATPRIVINGLVPSGIVDAVEFWITFDTGVSEASRNYIKIGQFTSTTGVSLTEDDPVSYTYTGLSQSDFYVKIRGINSITSGPYSDPSGLIEYVPIVVADTVSDSPVSIGGQLMGLGLLTLLNNLDKLFGGDSSPGGLFDKIFEVFQDKTGVDLVGQAEGGDLVVRNSTDIDGLSDVDTSTAKPLIDDKLIWDGVNWVPESALTEPACYPLFAKTKYPPDRTTWQAPWAEETSDKAPITGSYFLRFAPQTVKGNPTATPPVAPTYGAIYSALVRGAGNIKLYKSNGTLVETVTASSIIIDNDVVEIPFATRDKGTDYYVLMDAGVVSYEGCSNAAMDKPTDWNFNTPWSTQVAYTSQTGYGEKSVIGALTSPPAECATGPVLAAWLVESSPFTGLTKVNRQTNIIVIFDIDIAFGTSGTVAITGHQTFNVTQTFQSNKVSELLEIKKDPRAGTTLTSNALYINPTLDLTPGTTYTVTISANALTNTCGTLGNAAVTGTTIQFTVDAGPTATVALKSTNGSVNQGGVDMTYDRTVVAGTGKVKVYQGSTLLKEVAGNDPAVTYTEV